jgi:uncharacterized protein YecE (DUF72 family)
MRSRVGHRGRGTLMPMTVRIGISGWRYGPWRGVFYPEGLVQRRELGYAAELFPSIEINGSFYSLQSPDSWQQWHDATPDDFRFAVKGPRYITHMRRLREISTPLANFLASGVLLLGDKLGPMLWQFPPNMRFDVARFDEFFTLLPRDMDAALALARKRDRSRMRERTALPANDNRRLLHAIEVRHQSFLDEAFIRLLRRHGIALVVADTAGRWPLAEDVTSDFMYLRLHGDKELYVSGYTDAALASWADRIRHWSIGGEPDKARKISELKPRRRARRDVYCYFDNDVKVHAPFDALRLMKLLGVEQPSKQEAKRQRRPRPVSEIARNVAPPYR